MRRKIKEAIRGLKNGKAAGFYNIPAELLKHGGEAIIDPLLKICNSVTEKWKMAFPMDQISDHTITKERKLAQL